MVVSVGIPRPVDLERAARLAVDGVAQIRRDAAVLSLELRDGVEGRADEAGHRRVQSAPRNHQYRDARTGLLIGNANAAFFIKARDGSRPNRALPNLLSQDLR